MKVIKGNIIDAFLGDLKDNPNAILLHVTNAKGVMGSGVALEIKNRIPEAYKVYMDEYDDGRLSLGGVSVASNVCNLTAQDGFGRGVRHLNYGALGYCLAQVKLKLHIRELQTGQPFNVYVPHLMGCDRAGGDWGIVSEMLDFNFDNVLSYKLN